MATSGYIQDDLSFGYVRLAWSESSQDVANNRTTISYTLSIYRQYNISSSASKSYSIVFNGSTVASGTTTIGGSGTKTIKTGTVVIPHNSDGTKTFNYSFSQQIDITYSGSWVGTASASGSGTLDTIARATQPALPDAYIYCGDPMVINTPRASTSFTHTLRYVFGSASGTIATGVGTTYTWTVPLSLLNQMTTVTNKSGTIYCDTYSGSTKIGTKSVTMYLYADSSIVPSFTSLTSAETVTAVSTLGAGYVQGMSQIKFTINGASGIYGSTITKYEVTFESVTYTGSAPTTNVVKGSGTITATGKITDSRGRTASKTLSVTVSAYEPPKITVFTVARANTDGTLNDMGTSASIRRDGTFHSLGGKNSTVIKLYSKTRSASTWTLINTSSTTTTGTFGATVIASTYDATISYDFKVEATDQFNTTISLAVMATGEVTMSWAPGGIGIGKVWESGALDVNGDVNISGVVNGLKFFPTRINPNEDLNNFQTAGYYYCPLNVDAQTLLNSPTTNAFSLRVERHAGQRQTLTEYMSGKWREYSRNYYGSTWGPWIQTSGKASLVAPSLGSGWTAYNTTSWATPGYYKTAGDEVRLQGMIAGGTKGSTIFTLPVGYRPVKNEIFAVANGDGVSWEYSRIYVYGEGDGRVVWTDGGTSGWISLSGIVFRTEQ